MTGLQAIMVAVDYSDLLAVTLPYNRHHFDEVMVVTDQKCRHEVMNLGRRYDFSTYVTQEFYFDGAKFNKWRALESGLDMFGRKGWLCVMDADVLWPRDVWFSVQYETIKWLSPGPVLYQDRGQLLSPLRRMAPWPTLLPAELAWSQYPIHRNIAEWAGYTQIFHASDPHLGPAPWHEVDWVHAGGADSLFQRKWPADKKLRPAWEVLHLGEPGQNWYGRATPLADGSVPTEAAERRAACAAIWRRRRALRAEGKSEAEQFAPEKLT